MAELSTTLTPYILFCCWLLLLLLFNGTYVQLPSRQLLFGAVLLGFCCSCHRDGRFLIYHCVPAVARRTGLSGAAAPSRSFWFRRPVSRPLSPASVPAHWRSFSIRRSLPVEILPLLLFYGLHRSAVRRLDLGEIGSR